jgi:hypothetical protein
LASRNPSFGRARGGFLQGGGRFSRWVSFILMGRSRTRLPVRVDNHVGDGCRHSDNPNIALALDAQRIAVIRAEFATGIAMILAVAESLRAPSARGVQSGDRLMVPTRIILGIQILETERPNRRYLGDVLARFRPVEMGCVAGEYDDASWWKGLDFVGVELITEADVEHARHDGIDAIFRMPVRH